MQLLIEQIKNNERKAQEILYKKYANRFFYLCFRYAGSETYAAEVLNNGFYKIFSNIHSFQFINNIAFEGWMQKIMIHESLMFLRGLHIHYNNTEIDDKALHSLGYNENHLNDEDCLKMLQLLPLGYRTVFNLYAIEGYSHQEISDMLNIAESTSRSQLTRAREILKTLITKEL